MRLEATLLIISWVALKPLKKPTVRNITDGKKFDFHIHYTNTYYLCIFGTKIL